MATASASHPQGAGRLASKAVAFALAVSATWAAFEAALGTVPTSYSEKKRLLEAAAPRVEALILGPSHAYFGLDPRELRPWSFNLSNVSQSLSYDRLLLERFLPRLPRLSTVLLSVSCFQLHEDLATGPEPWRTTLYQRAYGFASPLGLWRPERWTLTSVYGNREAPRLLLGHLMGREVAPRYDEHGRLLSEPGIPAEVSEASGARRVTYHKAGLDPAGLKANVAHLEAMITALDARGVRAVLVTPPAYRTYRRHVPAWVRTQTAEALATLAATRRVTYLDYFADARFERRDFHDNDHLSAAGAVKFTRLLARDADAADPALALARPH